MNFGAKISELRIKNDISQEELAEKLNVSRFLISKWENDKRRPYNEMIKALCDLFSVDKDFFESDEEAVVRELSKCVHKDQDLSDEAYLKLLNDFLWSLPEKERNIFIRRYYFFETPVQISEIYLIGQAHIRMILSRTRSKFKRFLSERK